MKLQDMTASPHSMTDYVHVEPFKPRAVDRERGGEKGMKFSDSMHRKHHRYTEF